MSLNKYMHPRNPFYAKPPDFAQLAQAYPEFGKYCQTDEKSNKTCIDFKNAESLRALCCVLLKSLFGLSVDLPLDHLIPRVPQRINYALWIEDLLERPTRAIGIDIGRDDFSELEIREISTFFQLKLEGCGASCIYPLIVCSMNPEWQMIASDVDAESIEWAQRNVDANNLSSRVFS